MTQVMKASEVRSNWSSLLNLTFRENRRIIIEKSGVPVAAMISADDLTRLTKLDIQREERFMIVDKMRAAFKDIPDELIELEVAKAIKKVRAKAVTQKTSAVL